MIDKKWTGHPLPASTMTLERGRLQFFARAIGETDPVYTDLAAARAAGYADLPAPPSYIFGIELESGASDKLLHMLGIPLSKLLHGEQGFTFHNPACAGDIITVQPRITEIYDKKAGALEFVVKLADARNQHGELVAELRTVLVCKHG